MGKGNLVIENYLDSINEKILSVNSEDLFALEGLIAKTVADGKKVIIVGNGGSAAISSHISVDLTKAAGVRAVNFNEADLLTCFSNDYGYEKWVQEALIAYADPADLLIAISSSGRSENIINGVVQARNMGLRIVTLSGFSGDNPLRSKGDLNLWCDSSVYNIVEVVHLTWLLAVVELLVHERSPDDKS